LIKGFRQAPRKQASLFLKIKKSKPLTDPASLQTSPFWCLKSLRGEKATAESSMIFSLCFFPAMLLLVVKK